MGPEEPDVPISAPTVQAAIRPCKRGQAEANALTIAIAMRNVAV